MALGPAVPITELSQDYNPLVAQDWLQSEFSPGLNFFRQIEYLVFKIHWLLAIWAFKDLVQATTRSKAN